MAGQTSVGTAAHRLSDQSASHTSGYMLQAGLTRYRNQAGITQGSGEPAVQQRTHAADSQSHCM